MLQGSNFPKKFYMKIRLIGVGPGGWNCSCCGPAPKERKQWCRMRKQTEKAYVRNLIKLYVVEKD